jgi:hypothetical protein
LGDLEMSKFEVSFNGRPEDLLREIGMSLNGLIRKLVGENGTKPIRSTFIRPENAEVGWIREHVVLQVAFALHQKPEEKCQISELMARVREVYKDDIKRWIEDNREKLAEVGFLRLDEENVRFDRFGRRVS